MKLNKLLFLIFLSFVVFIPISVLALTIEITAIVPGCGDGVISVDEQCDGANLGGASCVSQGFTAGTLSCTTACTFNTSSCTIGTTVAGGGGGGGGGKYIPPSIPDTNVIFTGRTYPLSRVNILKDGQLVVTTIAGPDSNFSATISGLSTGNYTFSVYGEDKNNIRSAPFSFPIFITSEMTTKISGIFIAPTISVDKSEVRQGDNIAIFGQSASNSKVSVNVNSNEEFLITQNTDANGTYLVNFDTSVLNLGQHDTKSKTTIGNEITGFSQVVNFLVGTDNILKEQTTKCTVRGDLNGDCKVNIVDFSIAAYWYKKPISSAFAILEKNKLNGDGEIDLTDFSIMAFYWTG